MDPEVEQTIVRSHGHLIAHSSTTSLARPLPLLPTGSTTDDSGPPSPIQTAGPIVNFAEVEPGIYRGSFPMPANLEHLRSLGLKTIL